MTTMPWVRLDLVVAHPKLLQLVHDGAWRAIAVWHFALPWCGTQGTAGVVPHYALGTLHARQQDARKLVEVGLWEPVPGGWYVHDWDHYQAGADEAQRRRERAQHAANARWSKARGDWPSNA